MQGLNLQIGSKNVFLLLLISCTVKLDHFFQNNMSTKLTNSTEKWKQFKKLRNLYFILHTMTL